MLQALTETGTIITPALLKKEELVAIRLLKHFFCPDCQESVIFRAGEKVIPHFAHRQASNCSRIGGESVYHMQGKLQLYHWLIGQYQEVYLEKHISSIQQRPDILVKIAHRTVAIEYQCTVIDPRIIRHRSQGYVQAGIMPIWLLGAKTLKRTGQQTFTINSFTMETLQRFSPDTSCHLIYYCPKKQRFLKVSDIHMTSTRIAMAHVSSYNAHRTTFPQLLKSQFLDKQNVYHAWLNEKKRLRLGYNKTYGKERRWRHWLYERGYNLDKLPAVIHLPTSSQYDMTVPPWHWQSRLILDFLEPLPINHSFRLQEVHQFLKRYYRPSRPTPLIHAKDDPGVEYLRLLSMLGYIQETATATFQIKRSIHFPTHIDEALREDRDVLQQLLKQEQKLHS